MNESMMQELGIGQDLISKLLDVARRRGPEVAEFLMDILLQELGFRSGNTPLDIAHSALKDSMECCKKCAKVCTMLETK